VAEPVLPPVPVHLLCKDKGHCFLVKKSPELNETSPRTRQHGDQLLFHFTLNDYENENIEPGIPKLTERIETFRELSSRIGSKKVIWRADPLILSDTLTVETLLSRVEYIGNALFGSTERLVFSFVDIEEYKSVRDRLKSSGTGGIREFTREEKIQFAKGLFRLNRSWGFDMFTCAEDIDLTSYGIQQGGCIDAVLMTELFHHDKKLMDFLGPSVQTLLHSFGAGTNSRSAPALKDPGQRRECLCVCSKDIGQYNTCTHMCVYCYANRSEDLVREMAGKYLTQHKGQYGDMIADPEHKTK